MPSTVRVEVWKGYEFRPVSVRIQIEAGATRIELAPGEQPTPPHIHGDAEEIFYVIGGSGLTLLDEDAYEIRADDCIVYKSSHEAHTIRAGDDGLDVIAFGAREYLPTGELPRGGTGRRDFEDDGILESHLRAVAVRVTKARLI